MGIVYPHAQLSPAKIDIVREWVAHRNWFGHDPSTATARRRFCYRFDDPAGEVGIESVLFEAGDEIFQVLMTYRSAELAGADEFFLTHMDHSVLGRRWVYLGLGDPVAVSAFASAITTGGRSVDVEFDDHGETVTLSMLVSARGTGGATTPGGLTITGIDVSEPTATVTTDTGILSFPMRIDPAATVDRPALLGSWELVVDAPLAWWAPAGKPADRARPAHSALFISIARAYFSIRVVRYG